MDNVKFKIYWREGKDMKISVASYSFNGLLREKKMDIFGYLETVRYRYHLNTADIWNGMLISTEDDYLYKIKEAMDEKELDLVNLCVDGAHVWDPNPDERERLYNNALAYLHAAEILGARTVRIDMGGQSRDMSQEQLEYVVMRYREYAERVQEWGGRVGPENHWGPSLVPANMKRVYEAVNHPSYGMLLHMGHWDEDEENGDRIVAPWTMHTHVDARTSAAAEEKIKILLDAGYQGFWGVEHHTGKNEYTEVEWQIACVKRALKHLKA
jgi:sugar phosphate isomerase/epimerase